MYKIFHSIKCGALVSGLMVLSMGAGLGGCSKDYMQSNITESKIRVEQNKSVQEIPVAQIHTAMLDQMALNYVRNGGDTIDLTLTYNPENSGNPDLVARQKAFEIADYMESRQNITVKPYTIPVKNSAEMIAVFSAMNYTAHPPEGCDVMSGFNDKSHNIQDDYQYGCTVQTVIARQIARPKDLLGTARDANTTDGRAVVNSLQEMRAGVVNEMLEGQTATE